MKVCDPACGSGHFLIAAAHRLAKRLAGVRTGDEEPGPDAIRKALRDVIGRCIYGVDINPMRDQKCIQDNFWDWRTPDSESGSPQHRSRKKESEHLVRAVLGLLAREENKLRESLSELQGSLKRAEATASEAAILPELHKAMTSPLVLSISQR